MGDMRGGRRWKMVWVMELEFGNRFEYFWGLFEFCVVELVMWDIEW